MSKRTESEAEVETSAYCAQHCTTYGAVAGCPYCEAGGLAVLDRARSVLGERSAKPKKAKRAKTAN